MIKEKLINFLQENDLPFIERENKVSHACINPDHDDSSPSAFTNLLEGEEFNHCSSCGFSLNTKQLHDFFEVGFDESIFFMNKLKKLLEPETDEVLARDLKGNKVVTNKVYLPAKYRDFCQDYRSVSGNLFSKIKAYYVEPEQYYGKRIIVPMYDYKNNLKSFEAISTSKKVQPKVLRPKGNNDDYFGLEEYLGLEEFEIKEPDTVYIAEGFFSALSFWELHYQGLCNFGVGSIENKLEVLYKKGIKKIILCGDNDEVGRKFNREMYFLLRDSFEVSFFKYKWEDKDKCDSNDLLKLGLLQERIDKTLGKI